MISVLPAPRAEKRAAPPAPAGRRPWAIAVAAFVLCVAALPELSSASWIDETAVLIALGAIGLPVTVYRAWGRTAPTRWPARAALGFVAVGVVSTLASATPVLATVGMYDWAGGLLFMAALAGVWGLGTLVASDGRDRLEQALIAGAVVNAVVALLQVTVGLSSIGVGLDNGQADGLLGNPVYLGGLLAAALVLAGRRFFDSPRQGWLPVALIAVGLGASGEKMPLLAAVVVAVWEMRRQRRSRRDVGPGAHRGIGYAVTVLVGVVAGTEVAGLHHAVNVVQKVSTNSLQGTFGDRLEAWRLGLEATLRRPLLGYGPGLFRPATLASYPESFVRLHPDQYFIDAHDFVVQYGATVGVLGAGLLVAWLVTAFRGRSGRLVGFAAVLLASELIEPQSPVLMPLAMLALAAAAASGSAGSRRVAGGPEPGVDAPTGVGAVRTLPRGLRTAMLLSGLVGVVAAGALLFGDVMFNRATSEWSVGADRAALVDAATAEDLLSAWPEPATLLGNIHDIADEIGSRRYLTLQQIEQPQPDRLTRAIAWYRVAADRDPTNPGLWDRLAGVELTAGRVQAAYADARTGQRAWPWWPQTLGLLVRIDGARHDPADAARWTAMLDRVDPRTAPRHSGAAATGSPP